ncbi:MAG: nucleotidyl transferase [Gammaproteobacteria bacterium RIFCSPHIGHO2_12_FULL_38_14]|nr:MAG: nucleotidyl transferase [Gammaproteobacteria bacterium RIFCSPHIGHO2_12_FULL_38_14]
MSERFPIVILAGGMGTRVAKVANGLPKALIPIAGEPFIAHQLRLLRQHQFEHVVLCTGYGGDALQAFVGDGSQFGLSVSYAQDGKTLRGTGGALCAALPALPEYFFVMYGDSYLRCNYAAIQNTYETSGKLGLMTIYKNNNQFDSSNVEYDGGKIICYSKKNKTAAMRYIDYGLNIFSKAAFASLARAQGNLLSFDLSLLHEYLVKTNELAAFEVTERFYEIGSVAGLTEFKQELISKPF